MKYKVDHDYHIHSFLSYCSKDPEQTPDRILKYAEDNGFRSICLTDHFWDHRVSGYCNRGSYHKQSLEYIKTALPLPSSERLRFYFGGEGDMDRNMRIGVMADIYDTLDFLIVPITHLHLTGFTISEEDADSLERRAELYVKRFDALLRDEKLIPRKTGIAHLTCPLMAYQNKDREDHLRVLEMISDEVFRDLFARAAQKGFGIELNLSLHRYTRDQYSTVLRPYFLAKEMGCKFYLGGDAHSVSELEAAPERFESVIEELKLLEHDKFFISET